MQKTLCISSAEISIRFGKMGQNEGYSVKREIKDAVMELMAEKSYMDITVKDIVTRAGVARASFYRNFNSINEVIDAISDELSEELIEDISPILHHCDERKWREFLFNHFYRIARRQKQMKKIRFENMSVIFTRTEDSIQQSASLFCEDTIQDKYLTVGKMGLINSVTKKWVDTGMKETPEEMIDFLMSFITKL